jgi:hypothetical protein
MRPSKKRDPIQFTEIEWGFGTESISGLDQLAPSRRTKASIPSHTDMMALGYSSATPVRTRGLNTTIQSLIVTPVMNAGMENAGMDFGGQDIHDPTYENLTARSFVGFFRGVAGRPRSIRRGRQQPRPLAAILIAARTTSADAAAPGNPRLNAPR